MNSIYTRIRNYESVIAFLGCWPSFDDFEIISILLERIGYKGSVGPSLTIEFSAFCPDEAPNSSERRNCLLTLRFIEVENLKIEGFNHQNAINGFLISSQWSERLGRDVFSVKIVQGFGVGCTFDCAEIDVLSIKPAKSNNQSECA